MCGNNVTRKYWLIADRLNEAKKCGPFSPLVQILWGGGGHRYICSLSGWLWSQLLKRTVLQLGTLLLLHIVGSPLPTILISQSQFQLRALCGNWHYRESLVHLRCSLALGRHINRRLSSPRRKISAILIFVVPGEPAIPERLHGALSLVTFLFRPSPLRPTFLDNSHVNWPSPLEARTSDIPEFSLLLAIKVCCQVGGCIASFERWTTKKGCSFSFVSLSSCSSCSKIQEFGVVSSSCCHEGSLPFREDTYP